jgi:hypothetical protein
MPKIKKTKISTGIFLLEFRTQKNLTSTFLRFQEFYESPKFQGKVFTLNEYKKWYTKVNGKFSYYKDWGGFNIPSKILKPFYAGRFDPLTIAERQLLNLFKDTKGKFYIIGTYKFDDMKKRARMLKHETAHALFALDVAYKAKVLSVLKEFDTTKIKNVLRKTGGYAENVLNDEINAYVLSGSEKLNTYIPSFIKVKLDNLYNKSIRG